MVISLCLQWTIGAGWLKAPPPSAAAVVLLAWGVFTLLLWLVTFRSNKAVWSIFLLLWITFFFLAWGDFGYTIGGVPPFGHATDVPVYMDRDLLAYPVVWAAAGRPDSVFEIEPERLRELSNAMVVDLK